MKRIGIFMILIACPLMTLGQSNGVMPGSGPAYRPAVPPPSTTVYGGGGYGYGYGYGGTGQTSQGAAMQGMSQVISAAGQYNLATSAAAVNMTEAESNQMRNNVQGAQTFWQMRDIGRAEREKERGPRLTPEQLARMARDGAPRGLSASQIDPVTGVLYWPAALQDANFQSQRSTVDEYTAKWVKYGGLDYADQTQVRENIDAMFDSLKSQISSIPPQDYVACRTFLQSLLYATTRTTL
ncbi:MAG: hypothetical protein ACLP9L_34195 [Thermoguttaceae bacterium]